MIKTLYETDYFGEVGITENKKRTASIVAGEYTELAYISKEDYLLVLESAN
jgi:CRP-like cAMP-binding protein